MGAVTAAVDGDPRELPPVVLPVLVVLGLPLRPVAIGGGGCRRGLHPVLAEVGGVAGALGVRLPGRKITPAPVSASNRAARPRAQSPSSSAL